MRYKYLWLYLLPLFIGLSACSSHTMITSDPSGAKVFIDGGYRGKTPYYYSDAKITGSETRIRLEKEGYEPLEAFLYRDEHLDVGALVGGIFTIVPFLWILEYDEMHYYQLQSLNGEEVIEEDTVKVKKKNSNYKVNYERLRELKKLLDEGIITKEEYEKEKKKILEEE